MNYILKSIPANGKAYGGFVWPTEPGAIVTAPDWDPAPQCGGGLHGALNGAGDGSLFCWDDDAVWICAEIIGDDIVDLGGKVKVRQCRIIIAGTREAAAGYLVAQGMSAVIGSTAIAGYRGTATAGYRGTATAGHRGTAIAGYRGTATAGYRSTATAGDGGTATAGYRGTATAGYHGTIVVKWFGRGRLRIAIGYVGEDGIEPNVAYRLSNGKMERA